MPIFGADYTEPDGSTFARTQGDFEILRKAVKEVDGELKKNLKAFKSMAKPMGDLSIAVNHFYDGPYTTTEYITRGSRLANMISRISVGIDTYDKEFGLLLQMVSSYGEKLKSAKGLIDDRQEKLADFNARKKSYTSAQSKEGKDPAKLNSLKEKFQAAKDAFESADVKTTKELNEISKSACIEFEECYVKYLKVQAALFMTAAAALGGAELPLTTTQYNITGTEDAASLSKEVEKKKKEDKKSKKKNRRTDVFEPSSSRTDDSEDEVPPPSLHTPPIETLPSKPPRSLHSSSNAPPPLPPGRPPNDTSPQYPDITTDLDLIGRDVNDATMRPRSQTVEELQIAPLPRSNRLSVSQTLLTNPPPSQPPSLPPGRAPVPAVPSGAPPLPPGRASSASITPIPRPAPAATDRTNDTPPVPNRQPYQSTASTKSLGSSSNDVSSTKSRSSNPDRFSMTIPPPTTDSPPVPSRSNRNTIAPGTIQPIGAAPPAVPARSTSGSISSSSTSAPAAAAAPSLPGRSTAASINNSASTAPLNLSIPNRPEVSSSNAAKPSGPPPVIPTRPSPTTTQSIVIPSDEVHKYGLIFKREDPMGSGFVTGQQAFQMFTRSRLPNNELAAIWELADQDKDGKLTKDEFIIAMWYINSRLKSAIDTVPAEVHPTLLLSKYPDRKLPVS